MGSDEDQEFFRVQAALMRHPDFSRWYRRLHTIGGCERPVYLRGRTVVADPVTGEVLREFSSADEPFNRLMVGCGNRRASVCASCSWWYQGDTFHLIRAGLTGGKGVPESVSTHPRVFLTLTAPSFGPVHTRVERDGRVLPCHPRRGGQRCAHGTDISCSLRHAQDDPALGTPLCDNCFDYDGAVLFNAHAGKLWHRFTDDVRRVTLPGLSGLSKKEFALAVRISFAKVAEYQRRGLVHFHAIVRLDGATGPDGQPPGWARVELLMQALRASAKRVRVDCPDECGGVRVLVFGEQIDVKPIKSSADDRSLSDDQVAGYVAKYATKAAECVGTLDRPIYCRDCKGSGLLGCCARCGGTGLRIALEDLPVSDHARRLVAAAWRLGGLRQYEHLHLRLWAHQCGFGGRFATKSRLYSTTLGALRQVRVDFAAEKARGHVPLPADAVMIRDWAFDGVGYSSEAEAVMAAQVRAGIVQNREDARGELPRIRAEEAEMREAAQFARDHDPGYAADRGDRPADWGASGCAGEEG